MIGKAMEPALNRQVNRELYSAYLYLAMAAYFESTSSKGSAGWMKAQAREEVTHAMRIYDYIVASGARVTLQEIEAPPAKWTSARHVFEDTCRHEKGVTGMIHDLVKLAEKEKDQATAAMLQWFVKEQVEEEEHAGEILEKVTAAGTSTEKLAAIDRELGKRK
jgi:ferritin